VGLAVVSSVGIALWRRALGPVDVAGGDVVVVGDEGLVQRDAWVYERAREDATRHVAWGGWTQPVFASEAQAEGARLRVVIDVAGRTAFEYAARRGETVAFVHREVRDVRRGSLQVVLASNGSPMRDLAAAVYVSPTQSIRGEEKAVVGRWSGVVVGRTRE